VGESFQFARAFWNRSPDRLMACAALMSHGRWMHLRICRKRASSTSKIRVRTREEPDSADLFRLRRPSRERRKSGTDSENDREPDQPHGHLDGRMAGWESSRTELLAVCAVQRLPRRALRRAPRRALPVGADRAGRRELHPGRVRLNLGKARRIESSRAHHTYRAVRADPSPPGASRPAGRSRTRRRGP
jgi:hypothetical protein